MYNLLKSKYFVTTSLIDINAIKEIKPHEFFPTL